MFKKYRLECMSASHDIMMNCADFNELFSRYMRIIKTKKYSSGHIMDNETGEIYTYFNVHPVQGIDVWYAIDMPIK